MYLPVTTELQKGNQIPLLPRLRREATHILKQTFTCSLELLV